MKVKGFNIPKTWKIALGVVGGFLLAVIAGFFWLQSEAGRNWVTGQIEGELAVEGGGAKIENLTGNPVGTFEIHGLVLTDPKGVWLSAGKVSVSWRPFSLFSGKVHILSILGSETTLFKFPEKPEGSEEKPLKFPDLKINTINLDFKTPIGAPGQDPLKYRLRGRGFDMGEGLIEGSLTLLSLDRSGDVFEGSILWKKEANILDLNASISGAPGGVVEEILGLKGAGPLTASLKGSGPVSDWDGTGVFSLATGWDFEASLKGVSETTLQMEGKISYPPSREDPWMTLLGKASRLSGTLEITEILHPEIDFDISFPGALAKINGTLNPEEGKFLDGLVFEATADRVPVPGPRGPGLEIESLRAKGKTAGTTFRPEFQGTYWLDKVAGPAIAFEAAKGEFSLAPWNAQVKFSLTGKAASFILPLGAGFSIKSPVLAWAGKGLLDSKMETLDLDVETLEIEGFKAKGEAAFNTRLEPRALALEGNFSLVLFREIFGLKNLSGDTDIRAVLEPQGRTLNLEIATTGFSSGIENLDILLGGKVGAVFNGKFFEGGSFEVMNGRVTGANLDLVASGKVSADKVLDLDYVAGIKTLEGVAPKAVALEGGMVITGKLAGPSGNPTLRAATRIETIDLGGWPLKNAEVSLILTKLGETPNGPLKVNAKSPLGPFQGSGTLTLGQNGGIALGNISAGLSTLQIKGNVELREEGVRGQLLGVFADEKITVAGIGISGQGEAALDFDFYQGGQIVDFRSNFQNIRTREISGVVSEIESFSGKGRLEFTDAGIQGPLNFSLTNGYRQALVINQINFSGTLGKEGQIEIRGRGNYFDAFDFSALVSPAKNELGSAFSIGLFADYGGRPLKTENPILIDFGDGKVFINISDFRVGEGRVSGQFRRTGEKLLLSLSAQEIDAVLATLPWRGLVSSGTFSGEVSLDLSPGGESLDLILYGDDLRHRGLFDIEEDPVSLGLKAVAENGRLDFQGTVTEGGKETGTLTASFFYTRKPEIGISPEKPITASFSWDGPVDPLWALTRLYDHEISGILKSNIKVSGTLDNPLFSGNARLQEGIYSFLPSGLILTGISLELGGAGENLEISKFEAGDGAGGVVQVVGSLGISEQLTFPGNLRITATNLRFVKLDTIDARASGDLVYNRGQGTASLSGEITTGRIEAEITQRLPKSVVSIDVREINRPGTPDRVFTPVLNRRAPLGLDLTANIPNQFFVRGRGLESEWGGKLFIKGDSAQPKIEGTLNLVRGYFDFAGKRLAFDSGRLVFDGRPEIDPEITLISRTRTPTIDAEIRIAGHLSSPQITMSSTPVLPEDEILSQLLFGASIQDLSALQLAELVSALASISGSGSGLNVLGGARKGLGLDILSITSDSERKSGALVTGGKYLTRDVYLEIETATGTGETITRLLYDITKRFRAESEVSQKRGSSLKIKWFWDY